MAQDRIGNSPTADLIDAPTFARVQAEAEKVETGLIAAKLQQATGALIPRKDFANAVLMLVAPPDT